MAETPQQTPIPTTTAVGSTAEGGGGPATLVPQGEAASAHEAGAGTSAERDLKAGEVAGEAATGTSGGGDPAGESTKRESAGKGMVASGSTAPVKEPLGPGPFGLDDFDTGVTLGTGSFGRVRIATHKTTQTPWAIKMLKKAEIVRMQQVRPCNCVDASLACVARLSVTFKNENTPQGARE